MAELIDPANPPNPEQRRARYEADMRHAADIYADVTEAIRQLEVPAEVIQTGGMCLAVSWPTRSGYWLLTDIEGPLPWDREHVSGWALGCYDDEGQPIDGAWADTEDPSVEAAVALVVATVTGQR